jgi:hypothetical protein
VPYKGLTFISANARTVISSSDVAQRATGSKESANRWFEFAGNGRRV